MSLAKEAAVKTAGELNIIPRIQNRIQQGKGLIGGIRQWRASRGNGPAAPQSSGTPDPLGSRKMRNIQSNFNQQQSQRANAPGGFVNKIKLNLPGMAQTQGQ